MTRRSSTAAMGRFAIWQMACAFFCVCCSLLSAQGNWITDPQTATRENLWGVGYGSNLLLAVGENGAIIRSGYDDPSWQARFANTSAWLLGVACGAGRWVVVGDAGTILISDDDGETWTARPSGTTTRLNAVAYGNDRWLAVGEQGVVLVSTDANIWTARPALGSGFLRALAFGQGRFLIGGAGGVLYTTTDGATFTRVAISTSANIEAAAITGGRFFVAGSGGLLASSPQLAPWQTVQTPAGAGTFRGLVARGDADASAVGDTTGYTFATSTWTKTSLKPDFLVTSATVGRDEAIAVGFRGGVSRSSSLYGVAISPGVKVNALYGTDVRLTATPTGSAVAISYQWRRNGVDLPGATRAELWLRSVRPADGGAYTVVATAGSAVRLAGAIALNVVPQGRPEIIDPDFNYSLPAKPFSVLPLADGKIYVAYTAIAPSGAYVTATDRLRPDGQVDPDFKPAIDDLPNRSFEVIGALADGRVYAYGNFVSVNGQPRLNYARLMPDGSLDPSFVPVDLTGVQGGRPVMVPDGRLLVPTAGGIVRLLASGAKDPGFTPIASGTLLGVNSAGQILVTESRTFSNGYAVYPPQSTSTWVAIYSGDGTRSSAPNVNFSDAYGGGPRAVQLAGDWVGSINSYATSKLYGTN